MFTLSFNPEKTRFRCLDAWFDSPQGLVIGDIFASKLKALNEILYGETILQLGGKITWLESLHFRHKWCATPYSNPKSNFISSFTQLPLERNSIDCVVAPLIMEAFKLPNNPIDEIDRVLRPMGYVVFFSINPLSLWGIFNRLRRFSCYGPLTAKPISVISLKRAMAHRGYIQCKLTTFYYIPPVGTEKWLQKLRVLNEIGKIISPCPAGFYCLVMQKQQEIYPDLLLDKLEEEKWKVKSVLQPV